MRSYITGFLGNVVNRLLRAISNSTRRVSGTTVALVAIFVTVFLVRFATINTQPGPPSEDLGGDLIVLHTYTQEDPVFPHFRYAAPPLYHLLVVLPLTSLFPPMLALKIIDALIPSILLFPFYFLSKALVENKPASVIGSYLFSFSEAFNEMMGWGGTLNLFSLGFGLISLFFLARLVRSSRIMDGILTATFLSLTVGTHQLTAIYVGFCALIIIGVSLTPLLKTRPSTRVYAWVLGLAGILSLPYLPIYYSLATGSVNILSNSSVPLQAVLLTLIYTNARTNPSGYILLSTASLGIALLLFTKRCRLQFIIVSSSVLAAALLIPLLNPTIYSRAAYFLPVGVFLSISALYGFLLSASRMTVSWQPKVAALLLIGLSVIGLTMGNLTRLQSSTEYYQVINDQTLEALNWISLHTQREEILFTNYPGLGSWIAGYSERTVLSPRPIGYIVTSPDYNSTVAANAIDAGNYVLDTNALTVADFFPAGIENPAIYVNTETGRYGLLFLDDDYTILKFNDATGTRTAGLTSAQTKSFMGYATEDSGANLAFDYSWDFGTIRRTVSLSAPKTIHVSYSVSLPDSNEATFTARILAFMGGAFEFSLSSNNAALVRATLSGGQRADVSVTSASQSATEPTFSFSANDAVTRLPTVTVQVESQLTSFRIDLWLSLINLSFELPIYFQSAFDLLESYRVRYLVLDSLAYAQFTRFLGSGAALTNVFQNDRIVILRLD